MRVRPIGLAGLCVVIISSWLSHQAVAWAFTLKGSAEVRSGQPVPVQVEVGKEFNVQAVQFFWYRLDEEPVPSHQATPAPFQATEGSSPITGSVQVPSSALGVMRLLAVGKVVRGRLDSHEEFDEVLVTVHTTAALSHIEFAVQKPWKLDGIGKRIMVPAFGQFADGTVRLLTGPGTGSTFHSSDEQVVSVNAIGTMDVRGSGKATVTVMNREKRGTVDVIVAADGEPNRAPIAEVAKELNVKSGTLVVLDGMRSRDPDGDPLRYEWKQLRGNRVGLTNVDEVKATFMAPRVSERKFFQFSLTVTDMAGPDTVKGAESLPAVVTVWVSP